MDNKLNSEGKFWLVINTLGAIVIVTTIVSVTIFSIEENKMVEELINKGHDPLEVNCAINDPKGSNINCRFLIEKKYGGDDSLNTSILEE